MECDVRDLGFAAGDLDLTGAWSADDGAIYYVRQIDSVLWYVGLSGLGGPEADMGGDFMPMGRAEIGPDLLVAVEWSDLPRGASLNHGTMTLRVDDDGSGMTQLVKIDETGTPTDSTVWTPCAPSRQLGDGGPMVECERRDLPFVSSQEFDLTGVWEADDNALYFFTQVDGVVWYSGLSGLGGEAANLGRDYMPSGRGVVGSDGEIAVEWTDLPRGLDLNHGTMTLVVWDSGTGQTEIRKIDETGGPTDSTRWRACSVTFEE